jgi:hypothetical protein
VPHEDEDEELADAEPVDGEQNVDDQNAEPTNE